MAANTQTQADAYAQLQSQQAALIMAHQQLLQQHSETEYFYVYVAESEISNVGYWIALESNKTLSLNNLRNHYATCFGIKYKFLDGKGELKTNYIRYHNGYFRFPAGLNMNKTRFIAYYYSDLSDVKAFMDMADVNDAIPLLESNASLPENTSFLGQSITNFDMHKILLRGAQSTPKVITAQENVSSTSDVILNEPPVDVITINDSTIVPPVPQAPSTSRNNERLLNMQSNSNASLVSLNAGQNVSSTSNGEQLENEPIEKKKHKPITFSNSNGYQCESSSVMVNVAVASKGKALLHRCPRKQLKIQNLNDRTPLKVTLKSRERNNLTKREIRAQQHKKIVKIEDSNGRTTALMTKRKLAESFSPENVKRRLHSSKNQSNNCKRIKYEQPFYQQPILASNSHADENYYRVLNVLLIGFNCNKPVIHETNTYFSEFGIVTNLQLYVVENRSNSPEYYAFMKIRTDDTLSLFSDRHLYNGTVIYAIRVDGTSLPPRINCKICGYKSININYIHYHLEGQYHQLQLQNQLDSLAHTVPCVYRDSYYRMTMDDLYVQYPFDKAYHTRSESWRRNDRTNHYAAGVIPSRIYNHHRYY